MIKFKGHAIGATVKIAFRSVSHMSYGTFPESIVKDISSNMYNYDSFGAKFPVISI